MTDRRIFCLTVALVALSPPRLLAQQIGKALRIGWLGNSALNTPESVTPWDAFRAELRARGWTEGGNLVFVTRFAEGVSERHAQNVRELIDANVDVIIATSGPAAGAAKRATNTIPIVFASIPNPVEIGLVTSLARPGANLTGFTTLGLELAGKRLELLKEAFPGVKRVAFLAPRSPEFDWSVAQSARRLGLELLPTRVMRKEDLQSAIRSLQHADAWFVSEEAMYFANRRHIIELVNEQRKPAMYSSTFFVDAGGLMSYSVAQIGQYRQLAALVDRILRGAKPADIPVEQPTQLELAINMTTARVLGFAIPPWFVARADRLVE